MKRVVLLGVFGLVACTAPATDPPDGGGDVRVTTFHDPSAVDAMCRDERACDELWGANVAGCTASVSACLDGLTADQRDQWEQVVLSCISSTTTCSDRFTCYATAPRC